MQFSPMVIAVEQGQSVNFPNSDNIRHHVYSFSKAKRFETKLYANKPEAPVVFNQPGLVVLGCNIHDSMVGYIFVSPWQDFGVSNIHGVANINAPEPHTQPS
jgi:plastocyanin